MGQLSEGNRCWMAAKLTNCCQIHTGTADRRNVPIVRAAAAAQDCQERTQDAKLLYILAKLSWVAIVEFGRFIQFGVTAARCICADATNPLQPRLFAGEFPREMRWVCAVDHEVSRTVISCGVRGLDRTLKRLAGRQLAVGLNSERNRHRHSVF